MHIFSFAQRAAASPTPAADRRRAAVSDRFIINLNDEPTSGAESSAAGVGLRDNRSFLLKNAVVFDRIELFI